jgi:hypothetical protein
VQPRLDEAMGRRIGGSPKAQARFLDRIEGVRSPAVIEVTASPGKRCRFFGFYRDREGRTEPAGRAFRSRAGVPTKGFRQLYCMAARTAEANSGRNLPSRHTLLHSVQRISQTLVALFDT